MEMEISKWFTNKSSSPSEDGHSPGADTLQESATDSRLVDSSNETGTSIDITTNLATTAGTSAATTMPILPPFPLFSLSPPSLAEQLLQNRVEVASSPSPKLHLEG